MAKTFWSTLGTDDDEEEVVDASKRERSDDQPELSQRSSVLPLMKIGAGVLQHEVPALPERGAIGAQRWESALERLEDLLHGTSWSAHWRKVTGITW